MAILNKQIGWSQESNLLWEILKQMNKLAGILKPTPPAYKVFSFLLTQEASDPPTISVLENTLGIDITSLGFIKYGTGLCAINFPNILDTSKTAVFVSNYEANFMSPVDIGSNTFNVNAGWNNNILVISSSIDGNTFTDGILSSCPIEIRVYN